MVASDDNAPPPACRAERYGFVPYRLRQEYGDLPRGSRVWLQPSGIVSDGWLLSVDGQTWTGIAFRPQEFAEYFDEWEKAP